MPLLSDDDVVRELQSLPEWERAGQTIRKTYVHESFPESVAFALEVAFAAEAADHHPDITIRYTRVTLAFTTHSAGGLTMKDVEGARRADQIAMP